MVSLVSGASNSLEYSAGTMVPRVRSPPGDSTITCSPTVGTDQVRVLPARGVAHFSHSVVRFGPSWTRALAPSISAMVPRRIRFCSKRRMSDRSAFMHGMLPKTACGCTRGGLIWGLVTMARVLFYEFCTLSGEVLFDKSYRFS